MGQQQFVPGLELSRRFYQEVIEPLLHHHCGDLPYTAALIGPGSEVLGFDTERSTDHNWGPRLQLFLSPADCRVHAEKIVTVFAEHLPETFLGYSTTLVPAGDVIIAGPVQPGAVVTSLDDWLAGHLGFDPRAEVTAFDWLATPTQTLAEFTAGEVFHMGSVNSSLLGSVLPGIPTTSGATCWPASGSGSARKKRWWDAVSRDSLTSLWADS